MLLERIQDKKILVSIPSEAQMCYGQQFVVHI